MERPGDVRQQLESLREPMRRVEHRGLVAFEDDQPVAIGWTDLPHGKYGTIVQHALRPRYRAALAEEFVRSGLLNNTVVELIQFRPGDEFQNTFKKLGLMEHHRQKMVLPLNPDLDFPAPPPDLSFEQHKVGNANITGRISHAAHQISKDLEGYADFATPSRRVKLERAIFRGMFGKVLPEGTLMVSYKGEPAGACLMVGIPGWGYPRVGWVVDMFIRPELHGKGIGRAMFEQCLKGAANTGLPVIGLAVTKSNTGAAGLYEKLGFEIVEEFYEFVGPT